MLNGASRRGFLASLGGGLIILLALDNDVEAQESGGSGRRTRPELPENVGAWLHIAPDGKVQGFTGKVEVGQNARTSLTQAVADEMRCSPAKVTLIMGDTALVPWDMGTFGSLTTPTMVPIMRRMAATARETLLNQAAKTWGVDRSALRMADGYVLNGAANKKLAIGELAAAIDWVTIVGSNEGVTPPAQWTVAGANLTKVNAREIVTGKHRYSSDHKLGGMLYGRVLRAPSYGAKMLSVDASAAEKMRGVTVVRDGDFVGIAAADEHLAEKALWSIAAKWQEQAQPLSNSELTTYIKAGATPQKPNEYTFSTPYTVALSSTYTVAYIAHTPLEPRAAVAQWDGGKLTVWAGTQRPFGVRSELAAAFGLQEDHVRVIMPDTGSGYGGKHSGECALEAARLAKATSKPVKLIWSREEEFTWAYLRPAGVIDVRSTLDSQGKLSAWEFHNYMSGPSGLKTPYEVPVKEEKFHEVDSPLREGSYRGLASTANHFARESHMDELAALAGADPLDFRLANLHDPRLRAVLETAAERFKWKQRKPGKGYGLACGMEKGGHVACCVEIAMTEQRDIHVERVVTAWDCGAVINPQHLRNQVEGAIVMGLGGALFEEIEFASGRILNARLSEYRVPRFSDIPRMETILIDHKDIVPAGAGEIPIVAIAPAIANAVFNASGVRVRSMPILPALAKA